MRIRHEPRLPLRARQSRRPPLPPHRFTFIDLFAGIGGIRLGFEAAGGRCVYTSEWDEYARHTYEVNFDTAGHPFDGDITIVAPSSVPDHDVLLGGFPCQPFSIAGVTKHNALGRAHGFLHETQGTLFFSAARIIDVKRPRAFLLENVRNLQTHNRGRTFKTIMAVLEKDLGYHVTPHVVDASVRLPQHRERIYLVGFRDAADHERFRFPEFQVERPLLADLLECEVSPRYTLTPHLWQYLRDYAEKHRAKGNGFGFGLIRLKDQEKPETVTRTLSARYYKDGSEILIEQPDGLPPRRLTPRECARLMGFPDWFEIPVSDTRAYKQFGNSVAVPVVEAIAQEIARCIEAPTAYVPAAGRQLGLLLHERSGAFVSAS